MFISNLAVHFSADCKFSRVDCIIDARAQILNGKSCGCFFFFSLSLSLSLEWFGRNETSQLPERLLQEGWCPAGADPSYAHVGYTFVMPWQVTLKGGLPHFRLSPWCSCS
jgi:hypothetical protein